MDIKVLPWMFALPGICFYFGEIYNTLKVANKKKNILYLNKSLSFSKLIFLSRSLLVPEVKVKRSGKTVLVDYFSECVIT